MALPVYVASYQTRKWRVIEMAVDSERYQGLRALLGQAKGFEECSSESEHARKIGEDPNRFYFDEEQVAAGLGMFGYTLDQLEKPWEEFPAGTLVMTVFSGTTNSPMTFSICFEEKQEFDWVRTYASWEWERHGSCTMESPIWQELRSDGPLFQGENIVQMCHSSQQRPVPMHGRRFFCSDVELTQLGFESGAGTTMTLLYRIQQLGFRPGTTHRLEKRTLVMRVETPADLGRGTFALFTAKV